MIHHWLEQTRDHLRSTLTDASVTSRTQNIHVRPDGSPSATAGDVFIALWSPEWSNARPELTGGVYSIYTVICTISQRVRNVPDDREGDALYIQVTRGLARIAQEVQEAVSYNATLQGAVSTAVTAENASAGVTEPLRWLRTAGPVPRMMDWYVSRDPWDGNPSPAGYSVDVTFTGGQVITPAPC